jgi:hypothetical protein
MAYHSSTACRSGSRERERDGVPNRRLDDEPYRYLIHLDSTPCHFGGKVLLVCVPDGNLRAQGGDTVLSQPLLRLWRTG